MSYANRIIRAFCVVNNICENMHDQCDEQWCDEAAAGELPQPVCISKKKTTSSGERVRNALANRIFASKTSTSHTSKFSHAKFWCKDQSEWSDINRHNTQQYIA